MEAMQQPSPDSSVLQAVDIDEMLADQGEQLSQEPEDSEAQSESDTDMPSPEAVGDSGASESDSDSELDEAELQKLDDEQRQSLIAAHHPEAIPDNFAEVQARCTIRRDAAGQIDDPHHQTVPFMTKYEVTRVLGMRASQLDHGAAPLTEVPSGVLDGYQIARQELLDKKVPFIIRRPLPDGAFEYWRAQDLEVLFPIAPVATGTAVPNISIDSRK